MTSFHNTLSQISELISICDMKCNPLDDSWCDKKHEEFESKVDEIETSFRNLENKLQEVKSLLDQAKLI